MQSQAPPQWNVLFQRSIGRSRGSNENRGGVLSPRTKHSKWAVCFCIPPNWISFPNVGIKRAQSPRYFRTCSFKSSRPLGTLLLQEVRSCNLSISKFENPCTYFFSCGRANSSLESRATTELTDPLKHLRTKESAIVGIRRKAHGQTSLRSGSSLCTKLTRAQHLLLNTTTTEPTEARSDREQQQCRPPSKMLPCSALWVESWSLSPSLFLSPLLFIPLWLQMNRVRLVLICGTA